MGVIQLSQDTIFRIKSSQVITSATAALKELVENALDSKATILSIRLEDHGLRLLEVKDNGLGISEADLSLVCLPHTTSKIHSFGDLEDLSSYGFRGEALSSLCQLASVSITTRQQQASVGQCCTFSSHGKIITKKIAACNVGTTVLVTKLFHDLPVRLKYHCDVRRKKEQLKKIEGLLMAYAIAHPALHLSATHEKQPFIRKCAATNTLNAMHAIFPECASSFTNISRNKDQIKISVHLPRTSSLKSRPQDKNNSQEHRPSAANKSSKKNLQTLPPYCHPSTDRLFVIINGRPVTHKQVQKKVKDFFGASQPKYSGRWPVGAVIITAPPHLIDVNLEPNKDRVLINGEEVILELLTEILVEIYGPMIEEANPSDEQGKSGSKIHSGEESLCSDDSMDKENTDAASDDSTCGQFSSSAVVRSNASNFTNLMAGKKVINNKNIITAPSDLSGTDVNKSKEKLYFKNSTRRSIMIGETDEPSMVEKNTEIDGTKSNKVTYPENSLLINEKDKNSLKTDNFLLTADEQNTLHEILSQVDCTSIVEQRKTINDDGEAEPSLLRGVSGDIDPVAWSKGHVTGDDGINIESIRVAGSGSSLARRRGREDELVRNMESPAKKAKINCDENTTYRQIEPFESVQNIDHVTRESASDLGQCLLESTRIDDNHEKGINRSEDQHPLKSSLNIDEGKLNSDMMHTQRQFGPHDNDVETQEKSSKSGQNQTKLYMDDEESSASASDSLLTHDQNKSSQKNAMEANNTHSLNRSSSLSSATTSPATLGQSPSGLRLSWADRQAVKAVAATTAKERWPYGGHLVSKPVSAFASFAKHVRGDVLREFAGADFTVIGREIAARWKALDAETRRVFENKAKADEARYYSEIRQLRDREFGSNNSNLNKSGALNGSMERFLSPVHGGSKSLPCPKTTKNQPNLDEESGMQGKRLVAPSLRPWQDRCLVTHVTLGDIKRALQPAKSSSSKSSEFRVIGKIYYPSISPRELDSVAKQDMLKNFTSNTVKSASNKELCCVCVEGRSVYGVRCGALSELLECYELLETYSLPAAPLTDALPFNESSMGRSNWQALLRLPRCPAVDINASAVGINTSSSVGINTSVVTDERLTCNGFDVVLYTNNEVVSHGELVGAASNVAFYGMNDLREVLSYIASNPQATLIQTRPLKLRHWLQAESMRRTLSTATDCTNILCQLRMWRQYSRKYCRATATNDNTATNDSTASILSTATAIPSSVISNDATSAVLTESASSASYTPLSDTPSRLRESNIESPRGNNPGGFTIHTSQSLPPSCIESSSNSSEEAISSRLKFLQPLAQAHDSAPLEVVGLPNPELCLHNKPILHLLYNLDELPGSQSSR
ncbi:mismatch repair endonuclease pms1 [Hyalella azteca]|uniref:Mismatch repair endonuclease pms1 n=1 Tax=Hyalella azteca TaxID=294128 RepID=A0A8B7PQG5_HYAAZ|nr:mismatch repair endonuclease pms1 [Hyalella azteca]